MAVRYAFRTALRAAAVSLLEDYREFAGIELNVWVARPRSINLPQAFIDAMHEEITYSGHLVQRVPTAEIIVLHGLFDSKNAVDQADAFADGFLDWVIDRYHSAGANTIAEVVEFEDIPAFVPDWLPPNEQKTYYATRIALEGFASTG